MAETITYDSRSGAEVIDGKANEVLGITKAETYAVKWVNGRGQLQHLLCIVFGKMKDDGPGVFIMAQPDEMKKLTIPNNKFVKEFRQFLAAEGPVSAEDLPSTIGMDMGGIADGFMLQEENEEGEG